MDLFDYGGSGGLDPSVAVPAMKSHGVRTVYIETARWNSSSAFNFPTDVGDWIDTAHANGMKIVGWYLPIYGTYLNAEVQRVAGSRELAPGDVIRLGDTRMAFEPRPPSPPAPPPG